ncbi:alpha/beta hydrolase [Actinocorallia populi]|uniref:alpha/beta hydrolase n=1 Tax=Actinocorallia populi TaxID=2079200 RepID=UPI000D08913A|nr:alpha/beta hydrolase [Actinocorallia populi]
MEPVVEMRKGISLRARLFVRFLRLTLRPLMLHAPFTPRVLRYMYLVDALAFFFVSPRGTRKQKVAFDGFKAELVCGPGVKGADRIILYFHGGGFMVAGLNTHRRLVSRISAAAGAPALSVAYRQLPEANLAGSVDDCVTAYRHLLDRGYRPEQIIVAGDSAGGFLSLAAPLKAISEGLPAPGGIVAISPLTDLDDAAKLAHENLRLDAFIPGTRLGVLRELVLRDMVPDPLHSPVNGALADLPPVLIHAGSTEILRADAELMAERLAAAGVPATLTLWDRQPHVFQIFADLCPEGLASIAEIGAFVRALPRSREASEAEVA